MDFKGERERPSPSSDPAGPSLPASSPYMSHLGRASPVESPEDGSPSQHRVEQNSCSTEPNQLTQS